MMFAGATSLRISGAIFCRRQRLRIAIATARFAVGANPEGVSAGGDGGSQGTEQVALGEEVAAGIFATDDTLCDRVIASGNQIDDPRDILPEGFVVESSGPNVIVREHRVNR